MTRLKFSDIPYYNNDQAAGTLDPDDIFNCYLDDSPEGLTVRRRPGLVEFTDLGTNKPGQGIFEWEPKGIVVAVSNGEVYQVLKTGAVVPLEGAVLHRDNTVTFADGSRLNSSPVLYMANGKLAMSDNGGPPKYIDDGGAPGDATHVVYLNLRFLANKPGTNQFYFTDTDPESGILEPDFWGSSDNPLTAEARGDNILGLNTFLEEIYAWGSQSLEIWQDDGVTPFMSLPQGAMHVGLEAPDSVMVAANSVFALCVIDGTKCVVRITGRTPQVISGSIENIISGYTTVSDAIGQVVSVGGVHLYLLQFPSENKTWAYNMKSNTWVPWSTWDRDTGVHNAFIGQHSVFIKAWNKHLIMSRVSGKIYEFSRGVYEDDGVPIKSFRRTVWEDHGIGVRKRVKSLKVKVKTGHTVNGAAYLRWADNGSEEWSPYVEIPLYPQGKREFIVDFKRLGMYVSRRYEVSLTDDTDLCVVWVDEDVEALRF